jgi:transposase
VTHGAIDLGKKMSQVCILKEDGEIIECRLRTDRDRFAAVFMPYPRIRVLIEAGTESEWVARCLEELGHEVIVADPNYAPMYAQRQRKVKTDRRDALALVEACRLGAYRPAHRTSEAQRQVRWHIVTREVLVRMRSRIMVLIGSLVRQSGLHVPSGKPETFARRLGTLTLSEPLQRAIAPMLVVLEALNQQVAAADTALTALVQNDPRVGRLQTAPGVGPIIAATFVATVDRVERFSGPHQLEAYLGLVPREYSSGERQTRGRITKAGNTRLRYLLLEGAWSILTHPKPETAALRAWAARIASRRGKAKAAVALARRLAGILFAMMRDNTVFDAGRLAVPTRARVA